MPDHPPGRPSEGASVLLKARVSRAEAKFVQRAADGLSMTQSQFLRLLIAHTILDWSTPIEEETPNAKR